ncbi:NAD(P)-dependent oxidoreductase [Rhizobium sp. NRK18]|uniref:NAD(P)-dependent oxidoreductase n=1 Tax=Rhizobium sp. NRK18 TaxID=2964667 RepID=UPI0021C2AB3E|nr:NAD(P)-dependent oxidoreductase [Rhizobium sp. NRK18]MCQ2003223.1 DUF1932 domain-containing protein [Rhizobium sp. NRK18]
MTGELGDDCVIVIGYGEVGRAFGDHIERAGRRVAYVDPVAENVAPNATLLRDVPWEVPDRTLILGAIPSAAARDVAVNLAAIRNEFLYVDLSSSPPALMKECAGILEEAGRSFVDGAIMGSVDLAGAHAPIILSGPASQKAASDLAALGFDAKSLQGSQAGDACGLKLLRTLMTKGIEVLAIECFAAATAMGLGSEIRENLTDVCARPFPDLLDAMVRSHVVHATRRKHEVEAAIAQASTLGLEVSVTRAVLSVYSRTEERIALERPNLPMTTDEAVSWLANGMR